MRPDRGVKSKSARHEWPVINVSHRACLRLDLVAGVHSLVDYGNVRFDRMEQGTEKLCAPRLCELMTARKGGDTPRNLHLSLGPHLFGQEQFDPIVREPPSSSLTEQVADEHVRVGHQSHSVTSLAGQLPDERIIIDPGVSENRLDRSTEATKSGTPPLSVLGLDRHEEPNRLTVPLDDQCLTGTQHRGRLVLELPDTHVTHEDLLPNCDY